MDSNFKWRFEARTVAYIDLVVCTLLLAFVATILGGTATVVIVDTSTKFDYVLFWAIWVSLAFKTISLCMDLWAAVMLLKATKPEADAGFALEKAKIWRNIYIASMILCIVFTILVHVSVTVWIIAVLLVFRGCLIYIVCKFIEELEKQVSAPYYTPPTV